MAGGGSRKKTARTTASSTIAVALGGGLPNNGRFQLIVPTGISSSTCHLRYTVATGAPRRQSPNASSCAWTRPKRR